MYSMYACQSYNFSDSGVIRKVILNAPGSWHDARVARPIYKLLREKTPDGYFLVADTAFPRGTRQIAGRIRCALKQGERLPADEQERAQRLAYDRQLLSYRQTAEWGMRSIQGVFGRLRLPLTIEDDKERSDMLEVCMRLTNVRTKRVGINQIRSVYMPIWKDDDAGLWDSFETMLFGEI